MEESMGEEYKNKEEEEEARKEVYRWLKKTLRDKGGIKINR